MIQLDCYRTTLALATAKRARCLSAFLLVCAAGGLGAQPALIDTERSPDAVVESVAPNGTRQISRHFDLPHADRQKYVLLDDPSVSSGWPNGIVRWKYNDAGRKAALVGAATAAAAIATVQAAQAKWSAVCNVQFIYEGTTTSVPTPTNMNARDGVSAVGWTLLSGGTTGIAGIANAGPAFPIPIVEGDIVFNNTSLFDYDLDVTAVHETGHLLGIDHSDVSNVVMSGPPLTAYAPVSTLQPDDIAACVRLYGPPVLTSLTITGTVNNGVSALAGVTFCAQPATGVSCTASGAAGAYGCTVPNGWTGVLHAPGPTGLRIKPQSFSNVTANLSGQNPVVQAIGACNLDVDNNGLIEPATDGVAILRRMLGFNASGFAGLSGSCAANTDPVALFNATSGNYNATGGPAARPGTDGLVIMRAMRGLTGTAVTAGLGLGNEPGASNTTWNSIRNNFLNTTCGADFLP